MLQREERDAWRLHVIMTENTKYPRGKEIFEMLERCIHDTEGLTTVELKDIRRIVNSCSYGGYDTPIKKEVMYHFLEEAEKKGMRVVIQPDDDFLPGGSRENQRDGWSYHPVIIEKNVYTEEEEYWSTGGSTGTLPDRITPSVIKGLDLSEIFVFGSNSKGMHIGGAARTAHEKFGAEWGKGEGLQGQSYAIPTMEGMDVMKDAVDRFLKFAKGHSEYDFYVTPIGCGIAGYTAEEIAPLFTKAVSLSNVFLPLAFWKILR